MKKKRTSNKEFWCSVHGKFTGFQWGGHRRKCRAPVGKPDTSAGTERATNLRQRIKALNEKAAAGQFAQKQDAESSSERLVREIRSHLAKLEEEIKTQEKIRDDAEKAGAEATKKVAALSSERDQLIKAIQSLI